MKIIKLFIYYSQKQISILYVCQFIFCFFNSSAFEIRK